MHRHATRAGRLVLLLLLCTLSLTPCRAVAQGADAVTAGERGRALLLRGRRYWHARRYTESAAAYRRAARIAPDNPRAFAGLARAYSALGAHRLAVGAYRRALELLPNPPAALHVAHGDSLAAVGDRDGSERAYRAALRRDVANEATHASLDRPTSVRRPSVRRPSVRAVEGPRADGTPLVAGGVPLAIVGLATAVGCGVAYAMEPEPTGTGPAGSDPLTWVSCIGAGAVLATGGLVLVGIGLAEGVGSARASAIGEVRVSLSPTRGGARAGVRVTF